MKVAVIGYGNLGKSLVKQIQNDSNLQLVAVYSRRQLNLPIFRPFDSLPATDFDVGLVALGSYGDIVANYDKLNAFDTVDSYDVHAKIANYKDFVNEQKPNKLSIISVGWDPGVLSLVRGIASSTFADVATTWGKGISQGHSNALRSITGVTDAVQFTVPKPSANELMRQGVTQPQQLHNRICYVCCADNDRLRVERTIRQMPHYFDGYDVQVNFVTQQQIALLKQNTCHCGHVIATDKNNKFDFILQISDNTDFTAQIMLAYAKAIPNLKADGYTGALDVLDIPLKYVADCKYL